MNCCICGREGITINLGTTSIGFCEENECRKALNFKINKGIPILFVSAEDLLNHTALSDPIITKYEHNFEVMNSIAETVDYHLWEEKFFGEAFHGIIEYAGSILEEKYIQDLSDNELPLIIMNDLISDKAKIMLERRLKGKKS